MDYCLVPPTDYSQNAVLSDFFKGLINLKKLINNSGSRVVSTDYLQDTDLSRFLDHRITSNQFSFISVFLRSSQNKLAIDTVIKGFRIILLKPYFLGILSLTSQNLIR